MFKILYNLLLSTCTYDRKLSPYTVFGRKDHCDYVPCMPLHEINVYIPMILAPLISVHDFYYWIIMLYIKRLITIHKIVDLEKIINQSTFEVFVFGIELDLIEF